MVPLSLATLDNLNQIEEDAGLSMAPEANRGRPLSQIVNRGRPFASDSGLSVSSEAIKERPIPQLVQGRDFTRNKTQRDFSAKFRCTNFRMSDFC